MATESTIANLVINEHRSKAEYEQLKKMGKLKDGEIHLYPDPEAELSTADIIDIWNNVMNN